MSYILYKEMGISYQELQELPAEVVEAYLIIIREVNKKKEAEMKKQQAKAKAGKRR